MHYRLRRSQSRYPAFMPCALQGQTEGILSGIAREKQNKIREAARGRQKVFFQGSCGKMQGEKQK